MNRIDRLFAILLRLQTRRIVTAQDLAAHFEISERTVYRDMAALQQMGVPIVSQAGAGYHLLEGYTLPPLLFTPDEASAAYLGLNMLAASGNLTSDAAAALDKIKAVLPPRLRRQVSEETAHISFIMPAWHNSLDEPELQTLADAIVKRRVVFMRYHSRTGVTERHIEPLELSYGGGAWYLDAYCRLREDYRAFRVDRIEHMRVLPETFAIRDLPTKDDEPNIEIRVRFAPTVRRFVTERQHYGFVVEDAGVSYYHVDEVHEIRSWLLGWGANAEVLSPLSLRDEMREEAQKLVSLLT